MRSFQVGCSVLSNLAVHVWWRHSRLWQRLGGFVRAQRVRSIVAGCHAGNLDQRSTEGPKMSKIPLGLSMVYHDLSMVYHDLSMVYHFVSLKAMVYHGSPSFSFLFPLTWLFDGGNLH